MANPYSAIKVFHHKETLDALRKGKHIAPVYIRLKPTNLCNHHCAYCTYGSGNTNETTENRDSISHVDMIPWIKLQEIIMDMKGMGVKAVTFSGGGEPLTYPNIIDAVQLVNENDIELSLITNGQLLSGERAKEFYHARWVRISFDSPRAKEYMQLRGVSEKSFYEVLDNIQSFAAHKNKDCVLGINFVVSKTNAHLVYEAAQLLKKLGADNVKFAAVVENVSHYHDKIKDIVIDQIHRAQEDFVDNHFSVINNYENDWMDKHLAPQPFPTCYTCKLVTVIGADQKLYLCHTRCYDSKAVVGDLKHKSLKEVWFSNQVKKRLSEIHPMTDCKNFCVYQTRNELIQSYFDVDDRHINFI